LNAVNIEIEAAGTINLVFGGATKKKKAILEQLNLL